MSHTYGEEMMKKSRIHIPGTLVAFMSIPLLAGCHLFWTAPGNTSADWTLQRDTRTLIGFYEHSAGGSMQPNVVDTALVKRDASGWVETWVVDRNGTRVDYEVSFRPSPRGGTDISVSPKQSVKGE